MPPNLKNLRNQTVISNAIPLRDAAFQHNWNKIRKEHVLVGKELGLATINPGGLKYQISKWPSCADTGIEANLRIFRSTAYY